MDLAADTFLPEHPDLRIDHVTLGPGAVTVNVAATAPTAQCPCCGQPSARVHGRYVRPVRDLPWQGRAVTLRLTARKFLCRSPRCSRAVFCERLPEFLSAHARTTDRQAQAHRLLGFALGGEPGARVAERLAMPTSPDTLLRRVKDDPGAPAPTPRVVGVDDWALRKGHRYGTILIDLERGRVIDILPGRDGEALKVWLKEHPEVEVISRDRWASYAQAATEGAPQAQQVADRWHLLKNLREAVERLLERRYDDVEEYLKDVTPATPPPPAQDAPPTTPTTPAETVPPTPRQQSRQAKRQRRVELYERVRELHKQGKSARGIARELGMSVRT